MSRPETAGNGPGPMIDDSANDGASRFESWNVEPGSSVQPMRSFSLNAGVVVVRSHDARKRSRSFLPSMKRISSVTALRRLSEKCESWGSSFEQVSSKPRQAGFSRSSSVRATTGDSERGDADVEEENDITAAKIPSFVEQIRFDGSVISKVSRKSCTWCFPT